MSSAAVDKWVVGFRSQREWAWLIGIAFFLGGVGAGLFFLAALLEFPLGAAVGVAIVAVGKTAAHLLYLGRPARFWRAMWRPQTSWISRGLILVAVFVGFGSLYLLPSWEPLNSLPWGEGSLLGQVVLGVALVAALGVAVYTGFVLAYSPAIAFWNTALLPLLFLLYGFLGGIALIFVLHPWHSTAVTEARELLEWLEAGLLVTALVLIFAYLATMFYGTMPSRQAVKALVGDKMAPLFLGGVLGGGLLVPLGVVLYVYFGSIAAATGASLLVVSGLLELSGGLLFRYCLLRGGVYFPVI